MKKKMIVFIIIVSTLGVGIVFTTRSAHAKIVDDGGIICKCTVSGKCRVNGSGSICSEPGVNADCSTYDNICVIGILSN